ncbi:MAG: LysE family transporter [Verrucomicrobia bacterium]|nr:LysE family transporter [Verrucomicrobiota bacterium]
MANPWAEFSQVALAHLLAVASPGPDFAIVVRQSLAHGRRTAIWTSLGIGTGILLHVGYSVLGLGLLIRSSPWWFNVVKTAGAAYIAWLGLVSLQAKPAANLDLGAEGGPRTPTTHGAFMTGFLTNILNPKVTLFFISLFVMIVDPRTPKLIQAGYGIWMSLATMAWFTLVSLVFTRADVRRRFLSHGHWIDRALGVVFLAFAVSLAVATLR